MKQFIKRLLVRIIPNKIILWVIYDKKLLRQKIKSDLYVNAQNGICPCCEKEVTFFSNNPWLRDHFICSHCRSFPRQRALMSAIAKYYPDWRNRLIYESSTSFKRGVSPRLKEECSYYTTSQFYPNLKLGEIVDDHSNQSLESLTYDDNTFDLVITQDVMEHVNDPEKAFKEIARILKPIGRHIFTVPMINRFKKSERWAYINKKGEPEFIDNPDFHGPWPVTMHWGYDIVEFIENSSGLQTSIEYIYDQEKGITAELNEVLVSQNK